MISIRLPRSLGCLFLALAMLAIPGRSLAQGIAVSITVAPPVLPVYAQPICPGDGYIWAPGYWAWDDGDYYWVPGTWILAPEVGFLWTPGYWGWDSGAYLWHAGYWGEHIGFYGGVDYGFGYVGTGFEGGYWQGGQFFYNTSVMNVNTTVIHNTFHKTVIKTTNVSRVSFNGGSGGVKARPTAAEEKYASERHIPPTTEQARQQQSAASDRSLRASVNHGKPPVAATAKSGDFKTGVVAARAGSPGRNTNRAAAEKKPITRPNHETIVKKESKPSPKPATSEHANARHTEAKPAPPAHENTAKTESKPSKPAPSEHANARHTEAKPAPAPHEKTAKTESKPSKPAPSEHANARHTEAKPAPAPHEKTAKTEKPSKPAPSEHANAPRTEAKLAPAHSEPAAHTESAPKPEHQSAPHPESKPAPEEKKPPH
jgi:hypothetical protein